MPITVPGSSSHSGALATACSGHSPLLQVHASRKPEAKEAALDTLRVSENGVAAKLIYAGQSQAAQQVLVPTCSCRAWKACRIGSPTSRMTTLPDSGMSS